MPGCLGTLLKDGLSRNQRRNPTASKVVTVLNCVAAATGISVAAEADEAAGSRGLKGNANMFDQLEDGNHKITLHDSSCSACDNLSGVSGEFRWSPHTGVEVSFVVVGVTDLREMRCAAGEGITRAGIGRLHEPDLSKPDWTAKTDDGTNVELYGRFTAHGQRITTGQLPMARLRATHAVVSRVRRFSPLSNYPPQGCWHSKTRLLNHSDCSFKGIQAYDTRTR